MKDINYAGCYQKITFKVLLTDFVEGLSKYKYPLCCVLQFVWESYNGLASALERREKYDLKDTIFWKQLNYVPCDRCIKKYMKENNFYKVEKK